MSETPEAETPEPVADETLLILLNADAEPVDFALPRSQNHSQNDREWSLVFDTRDAGPFPQESAAASSAKPRPNGTYALIGRSLAVLCRDRDQVMRIPDVA